MGSGQTTSARGDGKNSEGTVAGVSVGQPDPGARVAERERESRPGPGPPAGIVTGRVSGPAVLPSLPDDDELPHDRYMDREESWLRFNQRVLELAEDEALPLLERVRFLAIFASNLDEFFMVRVAGRMRRMAAGLPVEQASGRSPAQILENTLDTAGELIRRHAECFSHSVLPALVREGIEILRWKELEQAEQEALQKLFRERIYPVLTPLVVDPAHPFPYISGLSLSLAVMIADPKTGTTMFARVKVPPLLPRFLTVAPFRFVPLEDVIAAHLPELFSGLDVLEHHVFRVTRTRDLEIDEDVTEDLLKSMERELQRRRFEQAVRLEVEESMSSDVLEKLVTELGVDTRAVYRVPGPLDLSGLTAIANLDLPQLKYPPFRPSETALPTDMSIFTEIAEHDVLVHHPYDSFAASTQRLVVSAAADPRVLAIKHTLYRTSGDSEIVDALIDAATAGKQVVVVVEIKARFDERANVAWAHKLEEAGCHVVYGFLGLKTHCKMILVVREEPDGSLRRFCHIGTGNYHPKTARLYEDFGLLTADPTVGEDVTDLFNHLTGYSRALRLPPAAGRARGHPFRPRGTDPCADGTGSRRAARADPDEMQRDHRRGDHRLALPRVPGRGAGRRVGPRDLRRPARHARRLGEHPGAQHSRPVPGALADLRVRGRRHRHRRRGLDRQRRPHAPEPGPAGRDAGPGRRSRAPRRAERPDRHGDGRDDVVVVAGLRRHLDPASPGCVRRPPQRHSGVLDPDPAGPRH